VALHFQLFGGIGPYKIETRMQPVVCSILLQRAFEGAVKSRELYNLHVSSWIALALFIYLNTPQLCCGDEHETDTRLLKTISDEAKIRLM
jgi:hypothetical protein